MAEAQEEDEECKDVYVWWLVGLTSRTKILEELPTSSAGTLVAAEANPGQADSPRPRAPSRKKFDEEMEALSALIRTKELEFESIKAAGSVGLTDDLKSLRTEKNSNIEQRKKIDADLQKLNKEIPEMMKNLSRLESSLHYRNEDRINEAIRRLEWSIKMQNFKLSEEKKIVAEIDSLRRSKKTLVQYQGLKREMDETRARQRRMREERDSCFRKVTQLKQQEEKTRSDAYGRRAKGEQLKRELDSLYESKRQMVTAYKKQREQFQDGREKRRHESFKKREEEKRAVQAALKHETNEMQCQNQTYEDHIGLCNTLIKYLSRYISNTDHDPNIPGVTVSPMASPVTEEPPSVMGQRHSAASRPAELEDGQYVLLKKSDTDNYVTGSAKNCAPKKRRSRKNSMAKRITHTPEVLEQFMQLNLRAPTTVSEIFASLEQLNSRKLHYERESEVESEAELSVTESALYEMSRQGSHTESNDGVTESRPGDGVVEQLLQLSESSCHGDADNADDFECAESDCFRDWHTRSNFADLGAFPPLSTPPDFEEGHPRSRSEGSDSTPRSSSTVEGACGGMEEPNVSVEAEVLQGRGQGARRKIYPCNDDTKCATTRDGASVMCAKSADSVSDARATSFNSASDVRPTCSDKARDNSGNNPQNLQSQSATRISSIPSANLTADGCSVDQHIHSGSSGGGGPLTVSSSVSQCSVCDDQRTCDTLPSVQGDSGHDTRATTQVGDDADSVFTAVDRLSQNCEKMSVSDSVSVMTANVSVDGLL